MAKAATWTVLPCNVSVSKLQKNPVVTIDNTLDFEDHVNRIAKSCNYHQRDLRHIRYSLTRDIACCSFGSRIDHCNAILFEANDKLICKLQRVQGDLVLLLCGISPRRSHYSGRTTVDLRDLHWLPKRSCTTFKIGLLCYKRTSFLTTTACRKYTPRRFWRSTALDQLALRHWECSAQILITLTSSLELTLPSHIHSNQTVESFKS